MITGDGPTGSVLPPSPGTNLSTTLACPHATMYPKLKAAGTVGVARLGSGRSIRWSVSAMYTYSSTMRSLNLGCARNWTIECGRLTTTYPIDAASLTTTVGISFSSPSNRSVCEVSSRVKPPISPHGSRAFCSFQWWYISRHCHAW